MLKENLDEFNLKMIREIEGELEYLCYTIDRDYSHFMSRMYNIDRCIEEIERMILEIT